IMIPKTATSGKIIKAYDNDGRKHYDFQSQNRRSSTVTIDRLDGKLNPEFWTYAKLTSAVLPSGTPTAQFIKLVSALAADSETINSWKNGGACAKEISAKRD